MKKRLLAIGIITVLIMSLLAGCGGGNEGKGGSDKDEEDVVLYDYDYGDMSDYITLGQYKGLEYVPTELVVETGDTVSVSYVGRMDGEEFEGGTGTNSNLVIGSDAFIDGFEDGLIGMVPGETKVLELTFPDPYENNPDLAGKPVEFEVTINAINGSSSNEDADKIALWNTFFSGCEVKGYPEKELNSMKKQQNEYYESMAENYGMKFDEFLEAISMDQETFDAEIDTYCKSMIAQDMALYALARKENIEADDETKAEAKQAMIEAQGVSTEKEFEEKFGIDLDSESVKNSLEMTALLYNTLDFLYDNAVAVSE